MYSCARKPKCWLGFLSIPTTQTVRGSYSKSRVSVLTAMKTDQSLYLNQLLRRNWYWFISFLPLCLEPESHITDVFSKPHTWTITCNSCKYFEGRDCLYFASAVLQGHESLRKYGEIFIFVFWIRSLIFVFWIRSLLWQNIKVGK